MSLSSFQKSHFTIPSFISFFIFFLLLINNFQKIKSVYIYIDPSEKKCLGEKKIANTTFNIIYSISGKEESQNIITVEDPSHITVKKYTNMKSHTISINTEKNGEYFFCVQNTSPDIITLNFNFETEQREGEMVSIQSVENFVSGVHHIEKKLDRLKFNVRNSAVRKKTHFGVSDKIRNKVNIYALIKIAFLVLFAVFQIYMITSIFGGLKDNKKILGVNPERKPLNKRKRRRSSGDFL